MERENELYKALDDICTYLVEGEAFHLKAASECRKFAVRGFARIHVGESEGDKKLLDHLAKLLDDRLQYQCKIDYSHVEEAQKMKIRNMENFKNHFHDWIDRENDFLRALNFAISKSSAVDMNLYQYLCKMAKEVQEEVMRARMMYDNLAFAEFQPHHILVVSKWLHDYMEHEFPKTGDMNYNIG